MLRDCQESEENTDMLFAKGRLLWDGDVDLLTELLGAVDRHLARLQEEWQNATDADAFGYFDRVEHVTGLCFVACQTYITSIFGGLGIPKAKALAAGHRHTSGLTVAEIVNHSANYWKHRDAWHLDHSEANQTRIRRAFEKVGFPVDADYPLAGILREMCSPEMASFARLAGILVEWRDALIKERGAST
jgi:hypothetical protein